MSFLSDLKVAFVALNTTDYAQAATTLNAQIVTSPAIDISWSAIRDVLMNNFDWGTLVVVSELNVGAILPGGGTQTFAIKAAAFAIRECCLNGNIFLSSNTTIWNRLVAAANLLTPAAVGGISSASATAVIALRTPNVSKWPQSIDAGIIQTAVERG